MHDRQVLRIVDGLERRESWVQAEEAIQVYGRILGAVKAPVIRSNGVASLKSFSVTPHWLRCAAQAPDQAQSLCRTNSHSLGLKYSSAVTGNTGLFPNMSGLRPGQARASKREPMGTSASIPSPSRCSSTTAVRS